MEQVQESQLKTQQMLIHQDHMLSYKLLLKTERKYMVKYHLLIWLEVKEQQIMQIKLKNKHELMELKLIRAYLL